MKNKEQMKQKAHALRRQGFTKPEIAKKLGLTETDMKGFFTFVRPANGTGERNPSRLTNMTRRRGKLKVIQGGKIETEITVNGYVYQLARKAA